jgi:hypothetical protein
MNSGGVMTFARTLIALVGVLLSVVVYGRASGVTQQPPGGEYLLAAGRAGRIELGTSVDEMYQFFGRDNVRLVDLLKEGLFSPALEVKLAGATVVPAVVTAIRESPCGEFSVWGIDVRDPRFRTKDGFGVGSTAEDLRQSHPFQVSEAEGAHAAIVKTLQMSFSLTRQVPTDQQRVTSAWIWPDPGRDGKSSGARAIGRAPISNGFKVKGNRIVLVAVPKSVTGGRPNVGVDAMVSNRPLHLAAIARTPRARAIVTRT